MRYWNRIILFLTVTFAVATWGIYAQSQQKQNTTTQISVDPASSLRITLPSPVVLPSDKGSMKLLVIGDMGSGKSGQYDTGRMINTYQIAFPFETALTVGDNIYGADKAADMKIKFELAYRPLIDKGVRFYATLGNHDNSNQRYYEFFNMKGKEYYEFEKNGISFYALNSTYMDKRQLDWLRSTLAADTNKWKVAYFHHPPFSSGKFHGSDRTMREALHPLFVKYGVSVVFTGHDHFYERIKPQDGITYFVTGSGGQLRKGDVKKNSPLTAAYFDTDMAFMLVEFINDQMYFQTISRTGKTVDSGVIARRKN
ncbi:MAG: metallophosphoesterase [Blastocatellia bacterium]|nr:metallophosphoesterase [Blastocatellia bacterium]